MEFRKARESDINSILNIIRQAQDYLKSQGVNQWQNNYPNSNTIGQDIDKGYSYVLVENNIIIGTVALSFDGEKTYNTIYNGRWSSHTKYAVIHRIAVSHDHRGKGCAALMINEIEKICLANNIYVIRVDTHRNNMPMQKVLNYKGFKYCGIIYLEDGSERLAYEKILK